MKIVCALFFTIAVGILLLAIGAKYSEACNEAICASVVSKCMLTTSCKCDLKECTCCKECYNCLNYLYDECCSCVDLCPKPNVTDNPLSRKSHVEDFSEPVPALFQALTSEADPHERWLTMTYPVDFDMTQFKYMKNADEDVNYKTKTASQEMDLNTLKPNVVTKNCTVAFMAQCCSWNKCKAACQSMGAASFRWFHDGCCECIGDTCINYGINESRCTQCPLEKEDDLKDSYDDYGQDEDILNEEDMD
ncbi:twisted gastrulation protein homolog 1-A-like isoform X2 [Pseudomyrmex gracilis]|nr:twisted gastrulation protein homolog 1-A-like isoform X2 [Pseudomyrmex gracilis]XP_020282160.1 twisted gastrulation protein homolog 1-A-like isoform X2 [Pseudomyrmex gracilis]XP_020282161.1 twisted gastrulation protein homolog 1-A-like isoform X2 [Pseudomyrmex gracilis]XP_020282163.1 twisted gastrulation protein homolog 1-A-like isoform X2 [Pseudomyrmex gracilis]